MTTQRRFSPEWKKGLEIACRILAIREHSEKQLRLKLTQKNVNFELLDELIAYLYDENWLSEERFCETYVRSKFAKGLGRRRVRRELIQQDITEGLADKHLRDPELDWQSRCNEVLEKKLRKTKASFAIKPDISLDSDSSTGSATVQNCKISYADRQKLANFLTFRGFYGDEIQLAFENCCVEINER